MVGGRGVERRKLRRGDAAVLLDTAARLVACARGRADREQQGKGRERAGVWGCAMQHRGSGFIRAWRWPVGRPRPGGVVSGGVGFSHAVAAAAVQLKPGIDAIVAGLGQGAQACSNSSRGRGECGSEQKTRRHAADSSGGLRPPGQQLHGRQQARTNAPNDNLPIHPPTCNAHVVQQLLQGAVLCLQRGNLATQALCMLLLPAGRGRGEGRRAAGEWPKWGDKNGWGRQASAAANTHTAKPSSRGSSRSSSARRQQLQSAAAEARGLPVVGVEGCLAVALAAGICRLLLSAKQVLGLGATPALLVRHHTSSCCSSSS
jgi:hypothetical protein